jgi:hypothetical protein
LPTHNELALFQREFAKLTPAQKRQFAKAVQKLVNDLRAGVEFRPSLRIKRVQGHIGIYEMTWADDGRATFEYGPAVTPGEVHIIWRRIGTHDILKEP